jgi:SAM-dependent methyltransferase
MKLLALGFGTLIAFAGIVFVYLTHDKWKPYVEKTARRPANPLLVEALGLIQPNEGETRIALDLGAGAGNETAYLLAAGWEVWAIDASPAAVEAIRQRSDLQNNNRLHVVQSRFNAIDWSAFPKFDLIVAISTLSFSEPTEFDAVWAGVVNQLKPGGFFVGNFFGPKFTGYEEKDRIHMTWLDKDRVLGLFTKFETVRFHEIDEAGESATGVKTHPHIFEVVAKKANSAKGDKQSANENFQKLLDDVQWQIGGKIHFEEESGLDYVGLKEINKLVREVLKKALNIRNDDCSANAKIRLTRKDNEIRMINYEEKSRPGIGEEMHATLLYTRPRGFCNSETLKQVCKNLFQSCDVAPTVESIAKEYSATIKPDWKFKISEVALTKGAAGTSFVMAKLLFDDRENIYKDSKPISAGLHMTLVNSEDSILGDSKINDILVKKLNSALKNRMVKVAKRNGVSDLEFGISGSSSRIRAMEPGK